MSNDVFFLNEMISAFDFIKFLFREDNNFVFQKVADNEKNINIRLIRTNFVLYPGSVLSTTFSEKDVIEELKKACNGNEKIGFIVKDGNKDFNIGVLVNIFKVVDVNNNEVQIFFQGGNKFEIVKILSEDKKLNMAMANVNILNEKEVDTTLKRNKIVVKTVKDLTFKLIETQPNLPNKIKNYFTKNSNFNLLTYSLAFCLEISIKDKQRALEFDDCIKRGKFLIKKISKEIEINKLCKEAYDEAQERMAQKQKDYFLKEQISILKNKISSNKKKESNQDNFENNDVEELRLKSRRKSFSKEAKVFFERILSKIERMQTLSSDYMVLFNQAEFMISLPWLSYSKTKIDIKRAEDILNKNHFGMEKVKERIIEYLSVLKLKGKNVGGQILCLLGPCGVGKTSLCKDIAQALNRDYVKIALGGISDEAEIRGHMKTYVGAMAGRVIRSLQHLKHSDPVVVLDEIDKLDSKRGDPAAALLEALDPNQNNSFIDHYLEVPYDLSKIIFIATANRLGTIPKPLRDRLEIIDIGGYSLEEKLQIAKDYLVPTNRIEHSLKKDSVFFSDDVLKKIIENYTKESGVRELNRQIATIMRKICRKIIEKKNYDKNIKIDQLQEYLGCEKYEIDLAEHMKQPGTAIGLAWTEVGGDILIFESALTLKTGSGSMLTLTGSLGDVMKESAQIAFLYLQSHFSEFGIDEELFKKCDFHIHVPDGATPKDGPSAGITLFMTLLSLCTQRSIKDKLAMTGEMSLCGEVLPVGGIKEKVLAAKRAGIKTIIMCEKNEKDVKEIKKEYISDINFIFINHVNEVIKNSFI